MGWRESGGNAAALDSDDRAICCLRCPRARARRCTRAACCGLQLHDCVLLHRADDAAAKARSEAASAVSEWRRVLTYMEECGRRTAAQGAAELFAAVQSAAPAQQARVKTLQSALWTAALPGLQALKNVKWWSARETHRHHAVENLKIRTLSQWVSAREKYLREHPDDAEAAALPAAAAAVGAGAPAAPPVDAAPAAAAAVAAPAAPAPGDAVPPVAMAAAAAAAAAALADMAAAPAPVAQRARRSGKRARSPTEEIDAL